ncbi:MAG: GNAT family N-acetyltransferase, partial [Acidobacteria bacterium]|nr:GNAT family N-acetyltransferase [Acidobacteriota bacterium]
YIARGPQAMYAAHGFGLYLVTVRATGEKAGMCGILKRDALEDPDVGFAFLPAFRGHGYAREALDAVLSLAIDVHGLTRLAAIVDPANGRSVGLLERAGFRTERRITMPDETTELLLMGMDL